MSYHVDGWVCSFPGSRGCGNLKSAWPELLGKKGEEAKAAIERERPGIGAFLVSRYTPVTEDYCCNRVWIWVDCKENGDYANATVAAIPKIG